MLKSSQSQSQHQKSQNAQIIESKKMMLRQIFFKYKSCIALEKPDALQALSSVTKSTHKLAPLCCKGPV